MKLAIGSDHRGYPAKEQIKSYLESQGHEVVDFGCEGPSSCDYSTIGLAASQAVARHDAERGILLCGTGIGMSITANKVHGIRAALCHDELTAELARRHNDANVLCLPADLIGENLIRRVLDVWLDTGYEGGRHSRRLQIISEFESNGQACPSEAPDAVDAKKA